VINPEITDLLPKLREPADLQDEEQNLGRYVPEKTVEVDLDELVLGSVDF
jgi:hypothetical protein